MYQINQIMWTSFLFGIVLIHKGLAQTSNDPILSITTTVPDSTGIGNRIVYGRLAYDVVLTCFVENIRPEHQVKWERYVIQPDEDQRRQVHISSDMDSQDNMKWSIEKPTDSSWRLRIRSLHYDDESNYTCYVPLDTYGNRVQDFKSVVVVDPPRIIQAETSYNMRVDEGNNVLLTCKASGIPKPTIMWRRKGNMNLPQSAGGGVMRLGEEMTITSVSYTDMGLYICEAINEFGRARRDMMLVVDYPPKVSVDSDKVGQAKGYQRTLICYVDANPAPSQSTEDGTSPALFWSKQDDNLALDASIDPRMEYRIIEGSYGHLTFELKITDIQESDYGTYVCYAQNIIGSMTRQVELYETNTPQVDKGGLTGSSSSTRWTLLVLLLSFYITLLFFL